jgi:Raf kinase inhibitor-like YbhB/YbcL family protein
LASCFAAARSAVARRSLFPSIDPPPRACEGAMAFRVTSPAFVESDRIPVQFTCDGENVPPPIAIADPPQGTQSFALILDDPDAPRGPFTHWLAYDIPAASGTLRVAEGKTLKNSFGRSGYGGPCPPPGHGPHRYFFSVFAVDVVHLELGGKTRADLEAALKTHTLARAGLMGRYERKP